MTREVAIKAIQDFIGWFKEDSLIRKALEMAIQVLSQEPTVTSTDEPMSMIYPTIVCDDAISRQAVLQAVSEGCQEWRGICGRCKELINALPSVTQKCEKCAMNGSGSKYCDNCTPYNKGFDEGLEQGFRAIGAEVRQTGKWIRVTDKTGHLVWECDKCSWQQRFNTNFCPDCGAKMESEVQTDAT